MRQYEITLDGTQILTGTQVKSVHALSEQMEAKLSAEVANLECVKDVWQLDYITMAGSSFNKPFEVRNVESNSVLGFFATDAEASQYITNRYELIPHQLLSIKDVREELELEETAGHAVNLIIHSNLTGKQLASIPMEERNPFQVLLILGEWTHDNNIIPEDVSTSYEVA